MSTDPLRENARRRRLEACGIEPADEAELLAYGAPAAADIHPAGTLPLPDEPHVTAWKRYEAEAASAGAAETLKRHFVQLRFPIAAGISEQETYRAATRQGRFEAAAPFEPGLALRDPDGISIRVCPGMGGAVPVIVAGDRSDFEDLVRAFTERNEPADVPAAMGACLVRGLNNWSRIADYRAAWERAQRGEDEAASWPDEFRRLAARKEQYQDRLIILSRGPYSAVTADAAGLDEHEWLERSLVIRREHEFTHYFTYRTFGSIRSHVFDELVADFVGLLHAFGRYQPALALRFLGLESVPAIRPDGRFWVYRGQPPLSDRGMTCVARLAARAVSNLSAIDRMAGVQPDDLAAMGRLTLAVFSLSLDELASDDAPSLVADRLGRAS